MSVRMRIYIYTFRHIYIYMYIYIHVCVCVFTPYICKVQSSTVACVIPGLYRMLLKGDETRTTPVAAVSL